VIFFCYCYLHHRDLHSFPTRRSSDLVESMDYSKLYINGQWVESNSKDFIEVENPANREIIGRVPRANKADVDYAVKAAKEAFERSEEHTSELQSRENLVCRLLLEKKK